VQSADDNILEHPVIDLLSGVLEEDENEILIVSAVNDGHKTSTTSTQAVASRTQSFRTNLLNGTYNSTPTMRAKDGRVAWLYLSAYDHFPVLLDPKSNNQQKFRLRVHLAEPGMVYPHRILGDSDLYEQSDPALRLAIQHCQENDKRLKLSWQ
jgi:hypothetical protein